MKDTVEFQIFSRVGRRGHWNSEIFSRVGGRGLCDFRDLLEGGRKGTLRNFRLSLEGGRKRGPLADLILFQVGSR